MSITVDKINKLEDYGFHLIPIENKKPKAKRIGKDNYSWKFGNEDHYVHVDFKKGPKGQVVGATVDYSATIIEFTCTQK